jgi:uncharacterized protein YndB with AHSA1/START domain
MTSIASQPVIPPVVKSIVVARSVGDAFRLYTEELGKWWPSKTHSLGEDKVATVIMEARAGGRIFERWHDGTEKLWGTVLDCEAPHRVVHTWHVSTDPEHTSEVELRFVALGPLRTRALEHRQWERMMGPAAQLRAMGTTKAGRRVRRAPGNTPVLPTRCDLSVSFAAVCGGMNAAMDGVTHAFEIDARRSVTCD